MTEVGTYANSNYNGFTASLRHQFRSVQVQANYTRSHALDEISNPGFLQYNLGTNTSVLSPQDQFNLRAYNYGNADYDTRHYFSLNYVWQVPRFWGPNAIFGGWQVSGTVFARSGLPSRLSTEMPRRFSLQTTTEERSTGLARLFSPTILAEHRRLAVPAQ